VLEGLFSFFSYVIYVLFRFEHSYSHVFPFLFVHGLYKFICSC
jgi:hypothetical protein